MDINQAGDSSAKHDLPIEDPEVSRLRSEITKCVGAGVFDGRLKVPSMKLARILATRCSAEQIEQELLRLDVPKDFAAEIVHCEMKSIKGTAEQLVTSNLNRSPRSRSCRLPIMATTFICKLVHWCNSCFGRMVRCEDCTGSLI